MKENMLEVKDKDISAIKCIASLNKALKTSVRTEQWAKYKYTVMEKNYSYYKKCSNLINSKAPMYEVYMYIDECLMEPFNEGNFVNTSSHVFGYVKDKVTVIDKESFNELLKSPEDNKIKIKSLLQRLCKKYEAHYINESYYYIY